jgi:hypothetical protein
MVQDWQLLIVGLIIAAAACYVARSTFQAWRGVRGCGGGCQCPSKADATAANTRHSPLITIEQLTSRLRPTGRP